MPDALRVLSVCSGLGGLDLGLHRAGFSTVGFVEQEPFCRTLLTRHWPDVPHVHTDLIALAQDDAALAALPDFDVLAGGIPCQEVSTAGQRRGTAGARWLWPHFARILTVRRPAAALVENVRGLLNAQKGWAFASILRGAADLNYAVEWELLAAGTLGAPHKRERVFLIFTEVGTPALGGKVALGCAWPRAVGQRGGEGRRGREGAVGLDGRRLQKEGAKGKKKPRDPWTFKWPVAGRFAPDPTRGGEWTVFARTPLWPTPSPLPWEVAADAEALPTPRVSAERSSRGSMVHNRQWSAVALEQAVELKSGVLPREFHDESELTPGAARMLAEGRLRSSLPTPLSSDGYKEATGTLPRLIHTGHLRGRLDGLTREGEQILRHALPTPAASGPNDNEDPDEWEARRKILAAKWGTNGAGTPLAVAAKRRAALPTPTSTDAQDRDYQVASGTAYPTLGHAAKTAVGVESQMVRRALPTPRSEDGESADVSHARRAAGVVDSLTGVVRRALPTPQAHDAQGEPGAGTRASGGREADLPSAVRRALPTPTATTGGEVGSDAAREGGPDLRAEAHRRALPTPAARDFRDPNSADSQERRSDGSARGQQLPNELRDRGIYPEGMPGRLSPALPEWMLGLPDGWSCPDGPSLLDVPSRPYLPDLTAELALTTQREHRRPRLKALGNSVCGDVAMVIGEGLARAAGAVLRSREAAAGRAEAVEYLAARAPRRLQQVVGSAVAVSEASRRVSPASVVNIRPFCKWPGGKRQMLPQIVAAAARQAPAGGYTTYVEPFVGGGVTWMAVREAGLLAPGCRVILGDACRELMGAWVCVRDDVKGLITAVEALRAEYNGAGSDEERERLFLSARERIRALERGEGSASEEASNLDRFSSPAAAADLLLINRCGFNGLWRVNASGLCNVPWGKRARFDGLDFANLRAVSAALAGVELVCGDFAETLRRAAA